MSRERFKYATDTEVLQAGIDAYQAVKDGWADPVAPTDEEEVEAKNARRHAMIAAVDTKLGI